ncbi:MAG TPA: fatty acid--CoA ligase family protein, partial [Symbiobacteriaceae bacterium]|nr:fatty acid--CoA ligase family protein [Symbiobacteriaceae bacterium]
GFSSGSTGRPKGVVRRHEAWVQTFAAATDAFGLGPGGRFLVPGPLHFSASLFAALHTLEIGCTLMLERRFSPRRAAAFLAGAGVTGAFMVPTLYQSLVDESEGLPVTADLCLISCGEKLRPGLRHALGLRYPNARILEYYGSSETGFISMLPPEFSDQPASVGLTFPGVEIRIVGQDGVPVSAGEVGVLHVRSTMMAAGYLGAGDSVTPFVDAGGWVATGDLARTDRQGLIYLEGRADDAITSGGATVFPAEVEAVLAAHPAVAEVAVVGRSHPKRGEEIVAALVLRPGAEASAAELRSACIARLAPHKRPRALLILPDLPRTETGKVCRRQLRAQLQD